MAPPNWPAEALKNDESVKVRELLASTKIAPPLNTSIKEQFSTENDVVDDLSAPP